MNTRLPVHAGIDIQSLRAGVRRALERAPSGAIACVLAVGLGAATPAVESAVFAPEIDLASLLPENGGDGSVGFRLDGPWQQHAGASVSGGEDINGDGFDDMFVGDPYGELNGYWSGLTYVVYGRDGNFPALFPLDDLLPGSGDGSEGFALVGVEPIDFSGEPVSVIGDVNGDGIDDFAIGAVGSAPGGNSYAGSVYVVFGRTAAQDGEFPALVQLASLRPAGGGDGSDGFVVDGYAYLDGLGTGVRGAGDVNGDGIDDLVIGADGVDPQGKRQAGATYVVFGRDTTHGGGFPARFPLRSLLPAGGGDGSAGFVLVGAKQGNSSGGAVATDGDVNGDGIDDLVIGAVGAGQNFAGAAFVVFGRDAAQSGNYPPVVSLASLYPSGGGDGSTGFVVTAIEDSDDCGESVDLAGDVNGDGIDDVIVGCRDAGISGEAYLVFGRDTAQAGNFPAVFPLARLMPALGGDGSDGVVLASFAPVGSVDGIESVSRAGDVNGDGIDDVIIGAPAVGAGGLDGSGQSYVIFGRGATQSFPAVFPLANLLAANGGDGSEGFVLNGGAVHDNAGKEVNAAGDVNGDGIDDVIVGAPVARVRPQPSGAYVVFGRREVNSP